MIYLYREVLISLISNILCCFCSSKHFLESKNRSINPIWKSSKQAIEQRSNNIVKCLELSFRVVRKLYFKIIPSVYFSRILRNLCADFRTFLFYFVIFLTLTRTVNLQLIADGGDPVKGRFKFECLGILAPLSVRLLYL